MIVRGRRCRSRDWHACKQKRSNQERSGDPCRGVYAQRLRSSTSLSLARGRYRNNHFASPRCQRILGATVNQLKGGLTGGHCHRSRYRDGRHRANLAFRHAPASAETDSI